MLFEPVYRGNLTPLSLQDFHFLCYAASMPPLCFCPLLCFITERFTNRVSKTHPPNIFRQSKHHCTCGSPVSLIIDFWRFVYLFVSNRLQLLLCYYLPSHLSVMTLPPGYLCERAEIAAELIFPMIAYLNRMYGYISFCWDVGITLTLETFVSLQRRSELRAPSELSEYFPSS